MVRVPYLLDLFTREQSLRTTLSGSQYATHRALNLCSSQSFQKCVLKGSPRITSRAQDCECLFEIFFNISSTPLGDHLLINPCALGIERRVRIAKQLTCDSAS